MNYGKPTIWRLAILFIVSTFTFSACSTFKKAEAPKPMASAPKPPSKKGRIRTSCISTLQKRGYESLFRGNNG